MSSKKKFAAGIAVAVVALAIAVILIFALNNQAASPANMLSLGERYLLDMQFEQALVQFLAVIEIEPNNVRAYLGAAEAFVGLGQMENAANILRQGLEQTGSEEIAWAWVALDPDNYQIYLIIANLLLALADGELGARLGAGVLRNLAIEILRRGLERTDNEQIRRKLAELDGTTEYPRQDADYELTTDADDEQAQPYGEGDDVFRDAAGNISLTGMPPISFQEIADYGFPWGVTLQDLANAGRFGINQDRIDEILRMLEMNPHINISNTGGEPNYTINFNRDLLIQQVHTHQIEGASFLRFAVGMTFQEVVSAVAVSNPAIIALAENPTYENFSELVDGASSLNDIGGFFADDGTWQNWQISVSPVTGSTDARISLLNDGRRFNISFGIRDDQKVHTIFLHSW